jgi:hypothetical protein
MHKDAFEPVCVMAQGPQMGLTHERQNPWLCELGSFGRLNLESSMQLVVYILRMIAVMQASRL